MSITFSSIILIALILFPGIVFKRFYFSNTFSKQFSKGLFADRIITTLFWGTVMQLIAILGFLKINQIFFKLKEPLAPLTSMGNDVNIGILIENEKHLLPFIFYIAWCSVLAMLLGFVSHKLVRALRIDRAISAARFSNSWHYYFTSEVSSWDRTRSKTKKKFLRAEIDVSVGSSIENSKFFSGTLYNYTIDGQTGNLINLYLVGSKKYDKKTKEFKSFASDILTINEKNILDLNIRYINDTVEPKQHDFTKTLKTLLSLLQILILLACFTVPFIFAGAETPLWKSIISVFTYLLSSVFILVTFGKSEKGLGIKARMIAFALGLTLLIFSNYLVNINLLSLIRAQFFS